MAKKNRETRNRGLFLDPVKVEAAMAQLKITDRHKLAADAGRSISSIEKIWKRLKIDEQTAYAIAKALGRSIDELKLIDVPTTTDEPPQPSQHPFLEQVKAINDALSYLYATLQKANHIGREFRAEAMTVVHGMGQKVLFLNPIPDESINGREGSLIITFPISRQDAKTLMNAFIAGDLEEFEIVSVSISAIPDKVPEPKPTISAPTSPTLEIAAAPPLPIVQERIRFGGLNEVSRHTSRLLQRDTDTLLVLDAELIVHGATNPDASVHVQGEAVRLRPDGTFSIRMDFPDQRMVIPVTATAKDGDQQMTVVTAVDRSTKVLGHLLGTTEQRTEHLTHKPDA